MKKRLAMILAVIMVIMLVLPLAFTWASAASTKEVDRLKEKASSLAQQKKTLEKELKELEKQKKDVMAQKATLDKQIDIIEQEIENSEAIIAELGLQIEEKERELEQALEDEAIEKELFKKRVRAMEEGGQASYIGILVNADGFADLLGRVGIINDILDCDRKIMESLRAATQKVEETKLCLEDDKKCEEEAYATLEARKQELVASYKKAAELIETLEGEREEFAKAYEEAEKAEKELQKQIANMLAELAKKNQSKFVGTDYTWPLPGYSTITSDFGMRLHPTLRVYKMHTGVDIAAPKGAKILAANTGTVITAGYNAGYGNYVVIDHGGGQATLYAHMSKILVKQNQKVKLGENIGFVGSTGYSTGNHLHFEIIINGKHQNPMNYYKKVSG